MSTKINVRSPFYASYSEPTPPSVELTCELIDLRNMQIDQYGNVQLPELTYGEIQSYTCSDSDFSDGRFDTVLTDTSRTVTFTISIPSNFSNANNDTIDCDTTSIQPTFVCTGGVTTNGSIPNQALDTGGDTVTIDLSSYFTAGVDPISAYTITNNYVDYFTYQILGSELTIISGIKAGTQNLYVEATDGDPLTCNATQSIQITTTATTSYTCDDAYITGGLINQDGSIFQPTVNGTITAIKTSSGGTPITSVPANNTGSFIEWTLYFDITVPAEYSNAGATVECSKVYYQVSSSLPEFTCEVAGLTGQAISLQGNISRGIADKGTISGFSPIGFSIVSSPTSRTVDFSITPPPSGFSNSGGSNITCPITMIQPAVNVTCGNVKYYISNAKASFMTIAQVQAAFPSETSTFHNSYNLSLEGNVNIKNPTSSIGLNGTLQPNSFYYLTYEAEKFNVNTAICRGGGDDDIVRYSDRMADPYNPTGGWYSRIGKNYEGSNLVPSASRLPSAYWIKIELNGFISEVWFVNYTNKTYTRIDNI